MAIQNNKTTISPEMNRILAEELNEEMKSTVMPVTVFVGIETVLAFLGNLMIWYVFLFHYRKCNYKYFVLCLAFVDTISVFTTMPGEIVTQTYWFVYPVPMVCKIKSFFNVFTVCASAFGLLIIAVDRYRKVCRPWGWQITPKVALILILVQYFIAFVTAMPVPFFWGTHSYQTLYKGYNITVTLCEKDEDFKNSPHVLEYTIVTETFISAAMIIMFVFYVLICRQLFLLKSVYKAPSTRSNRSGQNLAGARWQCARLSSNEETTTETSQGNTDESTDSQQHPELKSDKTLNTIKKAVMLTSAANYTVTVPEKSHELCESQKYARTATKKKQPVQKIKRKTLIMFILTAVFITTTILYLTLLNLIANSILQTLSKTQKSIYFFFFRLYFINHVINPVLYGLLDPQFRRVIKDLLMSVKSLCQSN